MEVIGVIGAVVIIVIVCILDGGSGKGGSAYKKGDLKIGRDMSGTHYVYVVATGEVLFEGTKAECARYIRASVG